jgi:hypothetical protein
MNFVVQVVDRRLTKQGVLYDDLANKAICGVCADARFSLAYTGLMMTPLRTDEWLAILLSRNSVLAQPFPRVLDTLAAALTEEFERFKDLADDQRRLTLAFAGFGKPGPFAATVSNQEDEYGRLLGRPERRFRSSVALRNTKEMWRLDLVFHGAEAAINDELKQAIAKIRRALFRKPGSRIASALVAIVRRAAKHETYGHLISPNCISMVLSASSQEIMCDDHYVGERRKVHLPHFVSPTVLFKHIWVQPG